MKSARRRTVGMGAAVLAAGLAIIVSRVALDARSSLRAGQAAEQNGQPRLALWHFQSAARAYLPGFLPGSGASEAAFDRLFTLGSQAEKAGDRDGARRAFDAFRGAALGARSFYNPHADRVVQVEGHLAELYADWELAERAAGSAAAGSAAAGSAAAGITATGSAAATPKGATVGRAELVRDHARLLAQRPGPQIAAAFIACVACLAWIGAAAGFFTRGVTQDLRLRRGPALLSGVIFVAGFAVFVLALRAA